MVSTSRLIGSGRFRKAAQRPHPPVLIGGRGPTVLDRVRSHGDAWFPNDVPSGLPKGAEQRRDRAGRPIDVLVMGVPADALVPEQLKRAGVRRVVRWLPSAGRGEVERALARFGGAVSGVYGE
jgi:alkanesulfonate monooxygenase SsuD/methylene tetrahydromethanopterin reductase-like flavin-dependent oxidoreductase (luciferase family)